MNYNIFQVDEESILNEYFVYWRKKGFPNYDKDKYNKLNELYNLKKFNTRTIFSDNIIKQTMHSCGFLWTYFPHWIDVKYGNQRTIRELWNDDDKLKDLIRKTYEWEKKHGKGSITINRLRQNSKVYLSKQSVSNFRPTVAKFIYETYGNNGVVWDMSCGWGGRLFGFLASNCRKYIGTEPSIKTFKGLQDLKNDFNFKEIELHNIGSEDFKPEKNILDLCFTSPPYYDTEKYSDEPTQSYLKFNTKQEWIDGFYTQTLKNCFYGLKKNGYLIINIANTPKHDWIEKQTIETASKIGFQFIQELKMELSSISGKGVKYEPIFIFKK